MTNSTAGLRPYLQAFDFTRLFVEGLGWNYYQTSPLTVEVDGVDCTLRPVAEKANFAVFECSPGPDGVIPEYPVRRKIEAQVAKRAFEHLIIFVDSARTRQVWQWVKREPGRPPACREQDFYEGQSGQPLLQRLREVEFDLDDEARGLGISEVTGRMYKAFDVEKVTKRFYDHFKRELTAFERFIDGITAQVHRDWYASLMLNRMMFVYFIQKQGFLDDNTDYLRTKLREVQDMPRHPEPASGHPEPASGHPEPASGHPEPAEGSGRFQQFYRIFLRRLFHEGLGQPEAQRAHELAELLGDVPFLNGGLFEVHNLERDNADISIPDEAFERVFNFFDNYSWHLDERPNHEDNEINPDVLGYIFEKYVNQKQMGAYYTKEDITGYISRNTVIPFLFDTAKRECRVAFEPDGGVWRLLRDDPDRYIYPAVGHGVTWNARNADNSQPIDAPFELPDEIAAGIDDVSKRGGWNTAAPEQYALPTETWREVVARRQRHAEVRGKLASGEVREINDLITLNLDIERFARDVIAQSEGPELLRAFWHALRDVSVLDPTCGSGAFLFAALNILEPLYTACLEGMRGFWEDNARSRRKRGPGYLRDFDAVLKQVGEHPNERYFILKSIVLNNLYGVDIMEEAVEICKLRLFLKLVAQLDDPAKIEPLPDIDFNIRAGNTLVGFTSLDAVRDAMTMTPDGQHRMLSDDDQRTLDRIEENAGGVAWKYDQFRWQQTIFGGEITPEHKAELQGQMESLSSELDRYLATEYGVDPEGTDAYIAWRASHKPFHWFAEFYGIMSKGGFDVVIGNPPYVEYRKVKNDYIIQGYQTESCGDLYAFCLERGLELLRVAGNVGLIVPISIFGADRFKLLQDRCLSALKSMWISSFANRPSQLFDGAQKRLSVLLGRRSCTDSTVVFTTGYLRWRREEFDALFHSRIHYAPSYDPYAVFPASLEKLGSQLEASAFARLSGGTAKLADAATQRTQHSVFYTRKFGYFLAFLNFIPRMLNMETGRTVTPSELKEINLDSSESTEAVVAVLSSSTFFWFWNVLSDCRNLNRRDLLAFPFDPNSIVRPFRQRLSDLGRQYLVQLSGTSRVMHKSGLEIETFDYGACKSVIDQIDRVLAEHYGFTDEELDFIINYDIKYRMGRGWVIS